METLADVRARRARAFLDDQGWGRAARLPLKADASFRRYERVTLGHATSLLMDAPPPQERPHAFALVSDHLRRLGYSAPRVRGADFREGFLLIEDFGEATFTHLLEAGHRPAPLYELATDLLVALHGNRHAVDIDLPSYDEAALLAEVRLFLDWWWPAVLGDAAPPEVEASFEALWTDLADRIDAGPRTLVLRDFHVDNLMLLPDRAGVAACGLLDFQDALIGHPAYDLVSLLEDARREVAPELADRVLARYRRAMGEAAGEPFDRSAAILAAQRHLKVIGIFTRLSRRDGKHGYLARIPRVWALLERRLEDPVLAPLARWMDETIPDLVRQKPVVAVQ